MTVVVVIITITSHTMYSANYKKKTTTELQTRQTRKTHG